MKNINNMNKELTRLERGAKNRKKSRRKLNFLMLLILVAVPFAGISFAQESNVDNGAIDAKLSEKSDTIEVKTDAPIESDVITEEGNVDSNISSNDTSAAGEDNTSNTPNTESNTGNTNNGGTTSGNNSSSNTNSNVNTKPSTGNNNTTSSGNGNVNSNGNSGTKPTKPPVKPTRPPATGNINGIVTPGDVNIDTTKPSTSTPEEDIKGYCKNGFTFSTGVYRSISSFYSGDSTQGFWKELLGTNFTSHKMRYDVKLDISSAAITVVNNTITIELSKIQPTVSYDRAHTQKAISTGGASASTINSLTGGVNVEQKFSSIFEQVQKSVISEVNDDMDFLMEAFVSTISSKVNQATGHSVSVNLK